MKKVPVLIKKPSYLATFFLLLTLNIGWTQADLSLWYIPLNKQSSDHQHGAESEFLIPCGWDYYHSYDGKSRVLEYGLRNEGDQPMTLTLPLTFETGSALEYSVMEQPTKTVLQPGDDVHFKVQYTPLGAYRPAKAVLNINSDALNASNCQINFRVGGCICARSTPLPFIINSCFNKSVGATDFDVDNIIDETITTTRTFDDKNNILTQIEVLEDPFDILGDRTTTNTYNANNQLVTQKIVATDVFIGASTSEMLTNTYDDNGNLMKSILVIETLFSGTITETDENTFDVNGNLTMVRRTLKDDFGMYVFTIINEYDVNNNLTKQTVTEDGSGMVISTTMNMYQDNNLIKSEINDYGYPPRTIENTYDANNNLLISIESEAGVIETTTNTYNALNTLVTRTILTEGLFIFDVEFKFAFIYDTNNRLVSRTEEVFIIDPISPSPILDFKQTISVTPCDLPEFSIADPCNCFDPLNKKNDQDIITHFHDVLSVNGTPGDAVILQTGGTNFLDNNLAQIANGTMLGTIPASGILEYDFFHASGASGAITLSVGGVLNDPFDISICTAKSCIVIPTMNQWGLFIFGLLLLNLSIFFIQRKVMY